MKIAITGANGAVGLNLLAHIMRRPELEAVALVRSARAAASLPEADNTEARIVSYDNIDRQPELLSGVTCLVHLAGILIEAKGTSYQSANVEATQAIVDAAKRAGVKHIVLISVLDADTRSHNEYLSSKGQAEQIVKDSGISATILRTPILFGLGTAGADALLSAVKQGKAKLLGGGQYTMRPLDVDDLCQIVLQLCEQQSPGVLAHDLVGPDPVPYQNIVHSTAALMGKTVSISSMPIWLAKLVSSIAFKIKGGGISPQVIDIITGDEVVSNNGDAALNFTLTPLTKTLEKIIQQEK